MRVIEMLEVFEARIAASGAWRSSSRKISSLSASRSVGRLDHEVDLSDLLEV